MNKKHFKTSFSLIPLLSFVLTTVIIASTVSSGNLFGPKKYKRTNGPSNTYTDTFKATGGAGRLVIINGDADGNNGITSAAVYLNGKKVFDHTDFKKKVYILERSVHLNRGSNSLRLELRGKLKSYITVKMTGTAIPPPTLEISARPESIRIGASSTLTWVD